MIEKTKTAFAILGYVTDPLPTKVSEHIVLHEKAKYVLESQAIQLEATEKIISGNCDIYELVDLVMRMKERDLEDARFLFIIIKAFYGEDMRNQVISLIKAML